MLVCLVVVYVENKMCIWGRVCVKIKGKKDAETDESGV